VLALNKPTVIFLMNAGAVAIDAEAATGARGGAPLAIIEAFYPGLRGGEALAQGIMGEMNAWGRLPYTIYPKNFTEVADMSMHDLRVPPGRTYRYYETPLFEFGSGLTLTSWSLAGSTPACLANLTSSAPHAVCTVTISAQNKGKIDGDVVIMAHFRSSRTKQEWDARRATQGVHNIDGRELLTPRKQLFDYKRLKAVKAGSATTVTFHVSAASVAMVDETSGDLNSEPGMFELSFDDGSGSKAGFVAMAATVKGNTAVLEPFPAET